MPDIFRFSRRVTTIIYLEFVLILIINLWGF
ncbi:hypothetical protein PQA65_gp38 [Yersinia phage vB_YenM_42.18]|uniref:Uncharacterized protein n=1 Tax=Yersinia phage vB_YenM_42.18 TaxID=2918926 RepID=A0AAE9JYD8_9CAUD|nr:hypothetical protein PQA65_gp38 [Yersinia phage vB_YenM_42.18]UNA05752.1 hypothetical protein vBYenM4218_038 [Yersinia phage vB_YenM_42.18]